jgi:hypothetical protein
MSSFFQTLRSLDDQLWKVRAAVKFGANGAPVLQEYVPPNQGAPGFWQNANQGGTAAFACVRRQSTGDFTLVLLAAYLYVDGYFLSPKNSQHLGTAASNLAVYFGELADGYPNQTSMTVERLASGHTGTGVAPAQPYLNVAGSGWTVNQYTGMTLTDSAGSQFLILSNTATRLVVAGIATPASGATWSITAGGIAVTNNGAFSGSVTSVAYVPATFTGATDAKNNATTWLVNMWVGQTFTDSTGQTFTVASNTATALTFTAQDQGPTPASGAWLITQTYQAGSFWTITSNALVGDATGGVGTANTWTPDAGSVTNWFAGQFGGMYLVDGAGISWLITANSTTVLTVASNGNNTTPTSGNWSIQCTAGAASIEVGLSATSLGSTALTGAPSLGTLAVGGAPALGSLAVTGAPALGTLAVTGAPTKGTLAASLTAAELNAALTGGTTLPFAATATGTATEMAGAPALGTLAVGGAPALGSLAVGGAPALGSLAVTGTPGVGTLAVSGSGTTSTLTDPAAGEVLVFDFFLSAGVVQG